jgi:hypothetical protein
MCSLLVRYDVQPCETQQLPCIPPAQHPFQPQRVLMGFDSQNKKQLFR